MDETRNMGEVQETGTDNFSRHVKSVIVLRTMATTEVAEDQSDGGDEVELSSPNAGRISICNIY